MAGKKNNGFKNIIAPDRLDPDGNYILDQDEIDQIKELWNVKKIFNLKDIVQSVWKDPDLDGRSKQAQALKKYLANFNASPVGAQTYVKKTETEVLSAEDKEYIRNHASEFKPRKISEMRWGPECSIGDLRYRLCQEYYDTLPSEILNPKYVTDTKEYYPPKTVDQTIARLRDYRVCEWEKEKLSNRDKECIRKTMKYCYTFRFMSEMNSLIKVEERKFCESQFLKWVHDKENLTEEDCDMYINLMLSMLDTKRMRDELTTLIKIRDDQLQLSVDSDDKPQINMALSEHITELRKEITGKESKQEATIKALTGSREKRMEKSGTGQASLAVLLQAWKEKDKRDKLLYLAEIRNQRLGAEVDRLATMDSLKFEIFGIAKEEIV